jgi:hypothetical protein
VDFWTLWDTIPLTARRWLLLIIGVNVLIWLPVGGYLAGADMEQWNIGGLNQSQSYQHSPGLARQVTWNWSQYLMIGGLVFGAIMFLIGTLYFALASKDKRSSYQ